jgi:uncharacterized protein YndB with AHSA1/START domain
MSELQAGSSGTTEREIRFTRVFDAPRTVVFRMWTDPTHLARWWGPHGFTNPLCELDARPGGAIRIDMTGPDGTVYPMGGVVREITPPARFVFTSTAILDAAGNPQLENLNTVTFEDENGKTKLTLTVKVLKATPAATYALAGMEMGWSQSLERLMSLVTNP